MQPCLCGGDISRLSTPEGPAAGQDLGSGSQKPLCRPGFLRGGPRGAAACPMLWKRGIAQFFALRCVWEQRPYCRV